MKSRQGFTLIEVLIALLIIAIALAGIIRATTQTIKVTSSVKEKLAAHWVAINLLSSAQVGVQTLPEVGASLRGRTFMMGRYWSWRMTRKAARPPWDAGQVSVVVFNHKQPISELSGFL